MDVYRVAWEGRGDVICKTRHAAKTERAKLLKQFRASPRKVSIHRMKMSKRFYGSLPEHEGW